MYCSMQCKFKASCGGTTKSIMTCNRWQVVVGLAANLLYHFSTIFIIIIIIMIISSIYSPKAIEVFLIQKKNIKYKLSIKARTY